MSGMLPLLLVLLLVGGVVVALRPVRTPARVTASEAWLAAERHARRVTLGAWAMLLLVPWLLAEGLDLPAPMGTDLAVGPAVGGIAFLVVHLGGELTWPRPDGPVRRAPLARRGVRDVAPRALSRLTATWAALLTVLLVVCGATAGADGRSLTVWHGDRMSSTSGPFPGWYYGRLVLPAAAVVVALCLVVLALVARRAAVADTTPDDDLALRRTSARRVLAGVQLVLAWTLSGCLFFAASSVHSADPWWGTGTATASSVVSVSGLLLAVAIAVASVVVAVQATRTLPRTVADALPGHRPLARPAA
jgi:small-conductance mechanosensitive channel